MTDIPSFDFYKLPEKYMDAKVLKSVKKKGKVPKGRVRIKLDKDGDVKYVAVPKKVFKELKREMQIEGAILPLAADYGGAELQEKGLKRSCHGRDQAT